MGFFLVKIILLLTVLNKYDNHILTAEAAPNTAISIPFSQGPSLKSSIIITAPTD